jgi:hypothetical protein
MPLLFFALAAALFLSWLLSASVSKLGEVSPLMRLVAVPTAGALQSQVEPATRHDLVGRRC